MLDLGSATAETVDFFCQFRCKLYFAGFNTASVPLPEAEKSEAELAAEFSAFLDFPQGIKFDVCLFWDYPSLLDSSGLKAFGAALKPYMAEHARAYGFGVLNSKSQLELREYRIKDISTIQVRDAGGKQKPLFHHTQRDFEELLPGFEVEKGTLLQHGKLEVLLEYTDKKIIKKAIF